MKQVLLLVAIIFISACAPNQSAPTAIPVTPTPIPTATPPTVALQFWTVLPDQGINEQNLAELVKAFQRDYPSITINVSSQPTYTDLYRKVVASIAAGTLPDLVTGLDSDILQYARLKALSPLDDYVSDPATGLSESDRADMPAGLRETIRLAEQDNKIYSLPFARGILALYYDWSAMKAIGITNTPKSWDEFRLHAKTLSKNPVRGFAYHPDSSVFDAMLMSRGGSLFSPDLSKATFNTSAGTDALAYISEGEKEGWIYRAEGTADMNDFAAGRTIFTVATTAAIPAYQDVISSTVKKGGKDFEWGVTLLPQADAGKPSALLVGSNIAMMRGDSARQQAAWLFMRWLMGDKVNANWVQAAGVLPAQMAARGHLAALYQKSPPQKQAFDDLLPVAHPEANVRAAAEIRDLVDTAIAAVESGKVSPKTALDDAATKVTILLNSK